MASFIRSFNEVISNSTFWHSTFYIATLFFFNKILCVQNIIGLNVSIIIDTIIVLYMIGFSYIVLNNTISRKSYIVPHIDVLKNIKYGFLFFKSNIVQFILLFSILGYVSISLKDIESPIFDFLLIGISIFLIIFILSLKALKIKKENMKQNNIFYSSLSLNTRFLKILIVFTMQIIGFSWLFISLCYNIINNFTTFPGLLYFFIAINLVFVFAISGNFWGEYAITLSRKK